MDINKLDALIFDFDGVLTDNRVVVNQDGSESVICNRADGLAFDVLKKLNIPTYILSTETNAVVSVRAKKLKVQIIQGVSNKLKALSELCSSQNYHYSKILYVGNDLNDYYVMKSCGITVCPNDAHNSIKSISKFILKKNGGDGIVREILEEIYNVDFLQYI